MKKRLDICKLSSYSLNAIINKEMFEVLSTLKDKTTLTPGGLSFKDDSNLGEWYLSCEDLKDKVNFGVDTEDYIEEGLGYTVYLYEMDMADYIKYELVETSGMSSALFSDLLWEILDKKVYVLEIESDDIILDNIDPMRAIVELLCKNTNELAELEKEVISYISEKLLEGINYTPVMICAESKVRFELIRAMHDELRQTILWNEEDKTDKIDFMSISEESIDFSITNIDYSRTVFRVLNDYGKYYIELFNLEEDDTMIKPEKIDIVRFIDYFRKDMMYNNHMSYVFNRIARVID